MPGLDPVARAEAALDAARDDLLQAKGVVWCTKELPVEGVLHGSLHPQDPIHQQAVSDLDEAKRHYDACWAALAEARQQQAQRQAAQRQTQAEAWVAEFRPEVLRELTRAEETYAKVQALPEDTTKPRAFNTARFTLQQAKEAYHHALAMAPTANGASH